MGNSNELSDNFSFSEKVICMQIRNQLKEFKHYTIKFSNDDIMYIQTYRHKVFRLISYEIFKMFTNNTEQLGKNKFVDQVFNWLSEPFQKQKFLKDQAYDHKMEMMDIIANEFDAISGNSTNPWVNKDQFHLFFSNITRYAFEDLFAKMDIGFLLTRKIDQERLSTRNLELIYMNFYLMAGDLTANEIYLMRQNRTLEGSVGVSLMVQQLKKHQPKISTQLKQDNLDIESLTVVFDQDKDGFLTVDEARILLMGLVKLILEIEIKGRNRIIVFRESMFSFIQTVQTHDEICRILENKKLFFICTARNIFDFIDHDQNGTIDFNEQYKVWREYSCSNISKVSQYKNFSTLDSDGNGILDQMEQEVLIQPIMIENLAREIQRRRIVRSTNMPNMTWEMYSIAQQLPTLVNVITILNSMIKKRQLNKIDHIEFKNRNREEKVKTSILKEITNGKINCGNTTQINEKQERRESKSQILFKNIYKPLSNSSNGQRNKKQVGKIIKTVNLAKTVYFPHLYDNPQEQFSMQQNTRQDTNFGSTSPNLNKNSFTSPTETMIKFSKSQMNETVQSRNQNDRNDSNSPRSPTMSYKIKIEHTKKKDIKIDNLRNKEKFFNLRYMKFKNQIKTEN